MSESKCSLILEWLQNSRSQPEVKVTISHGLDGSVLVWVNGSMPTIGMRPGQTVEIVAHAQGDAEMAFVVEATRVTEPDP